MRPSRPGAVIGRLKGGYVTNLDATTMPVGEVIAKYHDLWHVERSFRMSKTDLEARPTRCSTAPATPSKHT